MNLVNVENNVIMSLFFEMYISHLICDIQRHVSSTDLI
jgi:hypothetical protein